MGFSFYPWSFYHDQGGDSRKMDLQGEITNEKFTINRSTPLNSGMVSCSGPIKVGIRLKPGQRFGFHNFRHSLATFLINTGKDVKTIQGLLRDAKASTTLDLYSQAIDASKFGDAKDIVLAITDNHGTTPFPSVSNYTER
jgi:hypothetical protein